MSIKELAKVFLEDVERTENERQWKIRRIEAERRWHIQEAKDELTEYAELINKADKFMDVTADATILSQLYDQYESNPQYVAEEARMYRKVLTKNLQEAEEEARQKRLKQKQETARWQGIMNALIVKAKIDDARAKFPSKTHWHYHFKDVCRKLKGEWNQIQRKRTYGEPLTKEEEERLCYIAMLFGRAGTADWDGIVQWFDDQYIKKWGLYLKGVFKNTPYSSYLA